MPKAIMDVSLEQLHRLLSLPKDVVIRGVVNPRDYRLLPYFVRLSVEVDDAPDGADSQHPADSHCEED